MGKQKKNTGGAVYLNHPIQNEDEDWIGISTYVDKLDAAVEADARIVAVTSDFGTGKSSLISLYKNRVEKPFDNWFGNGKKVFSINMWGTYASRDEKQVSKPTDADRETESVPLELHKAFIYQLVSRINPRDRRKSNYISRRLSRDFGVWTVSGKNTVWSFLTWCSLVGFFLSWFLYKYQKYAQGFLHIEENNFFILVVGITIISILGFVWAIMNSEIIFSSKKSEGKQNLDENILIDLFKQEVMNHWGRQHYIIVIEDLDRIEDMQSALQFLRELESTIWWMVESIKSLLSFV